MALDAAHWQHRLEELIVKHKVPGANLAILAEGEVTPFAAGILNLQTGVEATTDSVFQIGSITKVYTATMVMQLVDEGLIDLDVPVITYLPDFKTADDRTTKTVTMRHLLSHTSGIDGDLFIDLGRGDDVLERYVAELATLPQNHEIGATFSYCNSGFVLAGRLIEVLTGMTWDQAVAARLSKPLGMASVCTLPEEVLRFRSAFGHITDPEGNQTLAPMWGIPRPLGPAGLINSTAADVLTFARLHLDGGRSSDGTQVLSEASVAAMQEPQIDLPDQHALGSAWGVGWILFDWKGGPVIGHDGNTIGQSGFLRIAPEKGVAVSLLVNGGASRALFNELYSEIFAGLAGITLPTPVAPPYPPVDVELAPYVGTYERVGVRLEVSEGESGLHVVMTPTGMMAQATPTQDVDLVAVDADGLFATQLPGSDDWTTVKFYQVGDKPYVHFGVRATPKTV